MEAFVHFVVGLAGGLLLLLAVDFSTRNEFALAFASAVWAMVPDGHWMLHEFGFDGPAATWKSFHASGLANVFWFHRALDLGETGRPRLEMGVALAGLLLVVGLFYVGNDWDR